jgi:hypothetical protein
MSTKETLTNIAVRIADQERRGDYTASTNQLYRTFDESGGQAGFSTAGRPMYLRADGRRVSSRAAAIQSYL